MVLETHQKLCDRAGFSRKKNSPQDWENGPKMGQKQGFFNLLKNLVIKFYRICSTMQVYIISCVPILHKSYIWKSFVPEICAKMFSANQNSGIFFHQPFLRNKSLKQLDSVHVDTNSHLKVDQKILGMTKNVLNLKKIWS